MSDLSLYESATAIANAAGRAVAQLQPMRSFEQWKVISSTVQSTSSVLKPTAKLYRGSETPSTIIEGTYSGSLDSTDKSYKLRNGERVLAVWTGCDVGASCTLTIEGTKSRGI